jgi:hypothetical protein
MKDNGQRVVVLAVAKRLVEVSINQVVTFDELSEAADCDVKESRNRWIFMRAKDLVSKDHGIQFASERGVP